MSWRSPEDFARETSETYRLVKGMIRRMAVTLSEGPVWQLLGQRGGPSGDETPQVEVFQGVGFFATPPASGFAEAIMVAIGGAKTAVVAALRDERTRKVVCKDLQQGETCVYNDKACIVVKADGTVEIRLVGGVAVPLARLSDVQAVRDALHEHSHTYVAPGSGGVPATTTGNPSVPAPVGTSVVMGQ